MLVVGVELLEIVWLRLAALSVFGWIQMLTGVFAFSLFYRYLVRPINWTRDLCDVGYGYLGNGRSKKELVREVRRRRRLGNMPPVFPNGWFMVLESDQLPPGQVRHVAAFGENLAVFRTQSGVVHVLDAYCPHLGANMAVGGVVRGDCLECPFHGWSFRGDDGRCSTVPYSDKVPEFAKVKKWESCEANTFIFVWYHAEGEAPTWRPTPIPKVSSGDWRYRGRSEFLINSHIQEIPENGGDVAHLNAIHGPSLFAGSDLRTYEKALLGFSRHIWSATWQPNSEPELAHVGTMNLKHEMRLFGKIPLFSMCVKAQQIGPGYVEMNVDTTLGPMTILQCVTPIEPLLQKVVHRIFCHPLLFLYSNIVMIGEAVMFERDIMVWNHKKYEDKPLLVKEDKAIQRHRRWYGQFYSENSPRFSYVKDTLEW